MKAFHALPPLTAVAVVGLWNLQSWQAVHFLRYECSGLHRRVSTARFPIAHEDQSSEEERRVKAATLRARKPIDWHYLSAQLRLQTHSRGRLGIDNQALQDLSSRIGEMSGQELAKALDEIAALGLDPADRALLEQEFFRTFISKEPVLALERFAHKIRDDPNGDVIDLQPAMEAWVKLDPVAATAWFDRAITAGVFESKTLDGRCPERLKFEAVLAEFLLPTNTSAAVRRIMALPGNQRGEALGHVSFSQFDLPTLKRYVEQTREQLFTSKPGEPFATMIGRKISNGDFAKADSFLNEINATPEERAIAAGAVVKARIQQSYGRVSQDDIVAVRNWLAEEAPQQINRLTGEALGESLAGTTEEGFSKIVQQVEQFHDAGGGDELLIGFIEDYKARSHPKIAKRLAEKIADPQRRAAIFKLINERP